jgi:hypothetical protein
MNCLDCSLAATHGEPVGTCIDCGAAVCSRHAVVSQVAVPPERTALLQRRMTAPPRAVRCRLCDELRHPSTDQETQGRRVGARS